jgi:hypothetical protein
MSKLRLRPWKFAVDEEVELYWLGDVYTNSEGLWMINCMFRTANGTFTELSFPFGTLPYLKIGQKYIDGIISSDMGKGKLYEVKMTQDIDFKYCIGFDFPKSLYTFEKVPYYGKLNLCTFEKNGKHYYIPCTEIVRSILAPYKTFTNRILRPNGLDSFVEKDSIHGSVLEIHMTEEYNVKLINDEIISYFVWLKYDKNASKCWNEVYKNLFLKTKSSNKPFKKDTQIMTMPPINGTSTWTFRGIEYLNHILILELIHRSDLELPFKHILFHHPSLKRSENDAQPRFVKNPLKNSSNDKDIELTNTEQGSRTATGKSVIEQPPTTFSFKSKGNIYKRYTEKRKTHSGAIIEVGTKTNNAGNTGTTQDWVRNGKTEQVEFSALKMLNTSLLKGLEEFVEIIKHIERNYKRIKISIDVIQLPQLKNFSKYEDGSIRTCAVVKIHRENRIPSLILEIGRADSWPVSTLIIKPLQSEYSDEQATGKLVNDVLKNLVENNGHWDKEFFKKEGRYIFDTVKHFSKQTVARRAGGIMGKVN